MSVDDITTPNTPRIGLVLGGGGHTGLAFHAGVLLSLEHHLGFRVDETVEVVVGTSAGSIAAALLRVGLGAEDLAALVASVEVTEDWLEVEPLLRGAMETVPRRVLSNLTRAPGPRQLLRAAANVGQVPLRSVLAGLMSGPLDPSPAFAVFEELGSGWPVGELALVTVRRDGRRVVFGGPNTTAGLAEAVAASCAIPGYFVPVRIGTDEYIDGGAHSPTNADVLAGRGLDLVIVSSPMSAGRGAPRRWDTPLRRAAHRLVEREAARLRSEGTHVLVIEPGSDELAAAGYNALDAARGGAVLREAFLSVGDRIRDRFFEPLERAVAVDDPGGGRLRAYAHDARGTSRHRPGAPGRRGDRHELLPDGTHRR